MYCFGVLLLLFGLAIGQDVCRTPNGSAGTCLLLETCNPLIEINKKPKKTPEDLLFLRRSGCGLHLNNKPKVCCPPKSEWSGFTTVKPVIFPTGNDVYSPNWDTQTELNPVPSRPIPPRPITPRPIYPSQSTVTPAFPETSETCEQTIYAPHVDSLCCGKEDSSPNKITGGIVAEVDQYPWLALLEYENGGTHCGGALVSARYVLTAAHCLKSHGVGTPTKVRLAEYNTTSYPTDYVETEGGGEEVITVVVIPIEKVIPHPKYEKVERNYINDIGLIKMDRNAPYTVFIRPICLPFEDITTRTYENLRFAVAGWGSNGTQFSDVKQHVFVPYVPQYKCQASYQSDRNKLKLTDTQICAGGENGKDSCKGDSGGPLMHELGDTFVIVGVVSFGSVICGQEGAPAIYTHVYKYLAWLKSEMV